MVEIKREIGEVGGVGLLDGRGLGIDIARA